MNAVLVGLMKSFLSDAVTHLADAKLAKIKAGLLRRGWNIKVVLQGKEGATAATLVKDVIAAVTEAF